MKPANGISIIIITRNRAVYVERLLAALDTARGNFERLSEVTVVDDSDVKEANYIMGVCRNYNSRYVLGNASVNEKRNLGASLSQYEILLFLDSDCEATPHLLEEHFRVYNSPEVGACLGLLEFVGADTWFWRAVTQTSFVVSFAFPKNMETAPWGPSANLSIRSDVFQCVQGFDTSFPKRPGGEDVDLGLRITKAGYVIRCNPKALVYHTKDTWNCFKLMRDRLFHWGVAECYLMARHPDRLKPTIPRFTVIFSFVMVIALLLAISMLNWWLLILPVLWLVTTWVSYAVLHYFRFGKTSGGVIQETVALSLILINEWGLLIEILRQRRFSFILKQMIYTPGQLIGEWHYGSIKVWSSLIGFFAVILSSLFL